MGPETKANAVECLKGILLPVPAIEKVDPHPTGIEIDGVGLVVGLEASGE